MAGDYGDFGGGGPALNPADPNAPDGEYPVRWHVKPRYRWSRRWVSGSKCPVCKTTALYEDMHPASPCPRCGARVKELVLRWIPDTDTWWPWLTRYRKGYWEER